MNTLPVTYILVILLSVIALSFAVYKYIKVRYNKQTGHTIAKVLAPFIRDEIDHIVVPDGVGGLVEIERLILLDQGILIISVCSMSGDIFGTEKLDQWTRLIKGKRSLFPNPLQHMLTSKQAISGLMPHIPVFCRVIFTEGAVFPKGRPDEVSVLDSLLDDLMEIKTVPVITDKAQKSWDTLMKIARKNGQAAKV